MKKIILFLSMISFSLKAESIKVALIDTNFCPEVGIKIKDRSEPSLKLKKGCRTHGQKILEKVLEEKLPISIELYSVFDPTGQQKREYWEKALRKYNQKYYDLTLMAIGTELKFNDLVLKNFLKTKGKKIVAAGQAGRGIERGEALFPQRYYLQDNIILVGGYRLTKRGKKLLPQTQFFNEKLEVIQEIRTQNGLGGSSQVALNYFISQIKELQKLNR